MGRRLGGDGVLVGLPLNPLGVLGDGMGVPEDDPPGLWKVPARGHRDQGGGGRHGHPHGFHRTVCRNGEETVSAAVWGRVALWDGDH